MASREFLASFGAEIDEAGVNRMQTTRPVMAELIRVRNEIRPGLLKLKLLKDRCHRRLPAQNEARAENAVSVRD